ncbi:MAG: FAD-dependent oxidoreductase [Pseudomonadota bacterium]
MQRRQFLKLTTVLAATASAEPQGADGASVVVAGAGIIGASIAFHLAKAGARVTIIDQAAPATHASRGTFAWINATWAKQPRHYHRLNQDSIRAWHELEKELDIPVAWGGSLEWFADEQRQDRLAEQIAEQAWWGEPASILNVTAVNRIEPELRFIGANRAAHSGNDGAVDPVLATQRLLDAAQALGAQMSYPSKLLGARFDAKRLKSLETSAGVLKADKLVLATGAAAALPGVIAGIDIPQRTTPGVIAITEPRSRILHGVVAAPGVHMHQRSDGRFVIGEQAGAPDTHLERLAARPNAFPTMGLAQEHGQRLLGAATRFVPALARTEIEHTYIGWRPLPLDGHPVLGAAPSRPDVYLAITHSGVTLAPLIGRLAARELLGESLEEQLRLYRPTREFSRVQRY